ncbi:MAG: glycosyltransferase family 4 protein [Bacteroidota bacterium]
MIFFFIIFISSFLITYLVRQFAIKKSIMDIPNERSSHTIATPRGGGLAIAITWFSGITFLFFTNDIDSNLYYALISGILISIISFIDDIYNLKSTPRIFVQAICAGLALYFVGGLQKLDLGFYVIENVYLLSAIAFIGIIWFINLFNFIDGIDGYTASETIFIAIALFLLTGQSLSLILAFSALGFLIWNWQKAKIFMGDIGSTLLGFTIIVIAIHYQNTNEISLINSLILTSVFWFDATYTLFKRFLNKEKLSQPHRKHFYQRIVQSGFSHQKTVLYAMFINVILFLLIYLTSKNSNIILFSLFINLLLLFIVSKLIDKRKPF